MTDYPLAGRATSIKLRDDLPPHAGHCAYCAAKLGKLRHFVVWLDGAGPLCKRCSGYSPLGSLAEGLIGHVDHGDDADVIVATWRRLAWQDFTERVGEYPRDIAEAFKHILKKAGDGSPERRDVFDDIAADIEARATSLFNFP